MAGGTTDWGPGRLQCRLCGKWFRPAGLSGHLRFYHGKWREQLEADVLHLAGLIPYSEMPYDVPMLINAFPELDENDLLQVKQRLQALRALQDIGR